MQHLKCGLYFYHPLLLGGGASFWSLRTYTKCWDVAEGVWPTNIELQAKAKVLEITFSDERKFTYPAEYLRVESPAAQPPGLKIDTRPRPVGGRRHVGIMGIEPVGNYAIRMQFDDLHSSGIYSWAFLYQLGEEKRARMREHITRLRKYGLTRNPRTNGHASKAKDMHMGK